MGWFSTNSITFPPFAIDIFRPAVLKYQCRTAIRNQKGRKIAVLGDMLELGPRTQAEHYRIGRLAAERVDYVLAFGPNGPRVLKGCITGGMVDGRVRSYTDRDELVRELKRLARPGDVLLFKGSRGMRMELVLEQFLDDKR